MPRKDGKGPRGNGPRDGRGSGSGRGSRNTGTGRKTGGKKGNC